MRTLFLSVMALALALAFGNARAALVIGFDDPETNGIDLRIEDNGSMDFVQVEGIIEWCGDTGPLTACVSARRDGTAADPKLILNVHYVRYTGGSIEILVTDTDYNASAGSGLADVNGPIAGGSTVEFTFYGDSNNKEFGKGFEITSMGPFNTPVDVIEQATGDSDSVRSLTISVFITGGSGQQFDINARVIASLDIDPSGDPPPDPPEMEIPNPEALSGNWYDPDFDGEGYNFLGTPVGMLVFYFGYGTGAAKGGELLWLTSDLVAGPFAYGEPIDFTMFVGEGGTFNSPAPSSELVEWGSFQVIFDECAEGRVEMDGDDGEKEANIQKIIGIGDLDCD